MPNGDPAEIFDRALTLLVEHLERTKLASARRPRAQSEPATFSRHMPSAVKRAVWSRDEGRCAFEGTEGRCAERGFLEFHHVVPYADGGVATEENIQLRCRAHNQHEAEEVFGPRDLFVRERPPLAPRGHAFRTEWPTSTCWSSVLDEVSGSDNLISLVTYSKTSGATVVLLPGAADYVVWYARDKQRVKYRRLYNERRLGGDGSAKYDQPG